MLERQKLGVRVISRDLLAAVPTAAIHAILLTEASALDGIPGDTDARNLLRRLFDESNPDERFYQIEMPSMATGDYTLADFHFMFAHGRRFVRETPRRSLAWMDAERLRHGATHQTALFPILLDWERQPAERVISAALQIIYESPVAITPAGAFFFTWPATVYRERDSSLAAENPSRPGTVAYGLWMIWRMSRSPPQFASYLRRRMERHRLRHRLMGRTPDVRAGYYGSSRNILLSILPWEDAEGEPYRRIFARIAPVTRPHDPAAYARAEAYLLVAWDICRRLLDALDGSALPTVVRQNHENLTRAFRERRFILAEYHQSRPLHLGRRRVIEHGPAAHAYATEFEHREPHGLAVIFMPTRHMIEDMNGAAFTMTLIHELAHHLAGLMTYHGNQWVFTVFRLLCPVAVRLGIMPAPTPILARRQQQAVSGTEAMRTSRSLLAEIAEADTEKWLAEQWPSSFWKQHELSWPPRLEEAERLAGPLSSLDKEGLRRRPLPAFYPSINPRDEDFSEEESIGEEGREQLLPVSRGPATEQGGAGVGDTTPDEWSSLVDEEEESSDDDDESGEDERETGVPGGGQKRLRPEQEEEDEDEEKESREGARKEPRLDACALCDSVAPLYACGSCHSVAYCGVICQALHHAGHSGNCRGR